METLFQVLALCLLGTLFSALLRRGTPEIGFVFVLTLLLLGVHLLVQEGRELVTLFASLGKNAGMSTVLLVPLLKTMAIALVVRIGSAFCRDASQSALAAVLEIAGTLCALLAAEPLLCSILLLLEEWL